MKIFLPLVFLDEVKIIPPNNNGSVHFCTVASAGKDTASDRNSASKRAFLINISSCQWQWGQDHQNTIPHDLINAINSTACRGSLPSNYCVLSLFRKQQQSMEAGLYLGIEHPHDKGSNFRYTNAHDQSTLTKHLMQYIIYKKLKNTSQIIQTE